MYDTISTDCDDITGLSREDRLRVWKAVTDHFTDGPPRTLGGGTGALVDMKITTPDRYTGIDPSQGMLNQVVRKHPNASNMFMISSADFTVCPSWGRYALQHR